jgi:pimeloyl-ACP methyl ester carboxylesterase
MPGSHRLKHILPLLFLALTATAIAAPYQAPDHHARMEHIVRNVSYEGGNELATILGDAQFHQQLADDGMQLLDAIDDRGSGLQAMVLKDQASGRTLIAFRGTELSDRGDIKTDADSAGDVGRSQYSAHLYTLDGWARDYPGATVIGHSLGGALGQRFIADHAGQVGEGVFFNSPGIAPEHAHRYASFGRLRKPPPVTIYVGRRVNNARIIGGAVDIYDYDIFSELGGQSHLPGTIVEVDAHALEQEIEHSFQMFDRQGRKFTQLDYLAWQKRRKAHFEDDAFVKRHVFLTKGEIRNFSLIASALGLGWFDGATHGYFQYGPMIPTRTMIAAAPSKDVEVTTTVNADSWSKKSINWESPCEGTMYYGPKQYDGNGCSGAIPPLEDKHSLPANSIVTFSYECEHPSGNCPKGPNNLGGHLGFLISGNSGRLVYAKNEEGRNVYILKEPVDITFSARPCGSNPANVYSTKCEGTLSYKSFNGFDSACEGYCQAQGLYRWPHSLGNGYCNCRNEVPKEE